MAQSFIHHYIMLMAILPLARLAIIKPKACTEVRKIHQVSQNGYFSLYDSTNKPYLAFCDFQSDPGFAWTLVESLSTPNARSSTFRRSFHINIPSNECAPNWSNYRLSKAKMTTLKAAVTSTHFRATCNFNGDDKKGIHNHRDYLRVSFCAYNYFLDARSSWTCAVVDYINIRGYSCNKCSIPFYSHSNYHLFTDLAEARSKCGRFNVPKAMKNECAFGHYYITNPQFSCTATSASTTNWWIGGAVFN